MDKVSKKKRSEVMRAIKGKDSEMELHFRKELRKKGLRFKTNVARLAGKPDVAFIKKRVAVFLDSCFWHGCPRHCRLPAANGKYWKVKIARNKKRDRAVNVTYRKAGWRIERFWEHELKKDPEKAIAKIEKYS